MLKNRTHLILLASIFLSFNYQIKTMWQPNKKTKPDIPEQDNNLQYLGINSLKYLSAFKYLQELQNALTNPNNILNAIDTEVNVPIELKDYCKLIIIDEHCTLLKQFNTDASLQNWFAPENEINRYKQLLYKICNEQYPDSNLILSIFDNFIRSAFEYYKNDNKFRDNELNLEYINAILTIFIKRIDTNKNTSFENLNSEETEICFFEIFTIIFTGCRNEIGEIDYEYEWNKRFKKTCNDLCKLLFKYNLLPTLDYEPANALSFLELLITDDIFVDIELIRDIINAKKDEQYDWDELLTKSDNTGYGDGDTIFHLISSKDKLEILLKLMEEKKLDLNYFLNIENHLNETPLMYAVKKLMQRNSHYEIAQLNNYFEIIKLLITYTTSLNSHKFKEEPNLINLMQDEKKDNYEKVAQIERHCLLLDLLKGRKYSFLNLKENLAEYKRLLYEILNNQYLNLNKILTIFDTYLSTIIINPENFTDEDEFLGITLKDINVILRVLIKHSNSINLDPQEKSIFLKILISIFIVDYPELDIEYRNLRIFLANHNLVHLDYIIPHKDQCNFFMYMAEDNNFDIKLFNLIVINRLKNINDINTIKALLGMRDQNGNTVLHYAAIGGSKNKVTAILDLIKHYNLNLNDFINIQNYKGESAFTIALGKDYHKIVNVLVLHGAVPDLVPE